jgi:hypothetical protein
MAISKKTSSLPHAFDSLRAEHEGQWLSQVYIWPDDFVSMSGMRSFVVFGGEGSGKTALRIALQKQMSEQDGDSAPFGVRWHPEPIHAEPREIVRIFTSQMLDACAQEMLYYAYRHPMALKSSLPWVQEAAAWFVQTYFLGDWRFELERLGAEYSGKSTDGLQELLSRQTRSILPAHATPARVISLVATISKHLGVKGVWCFVDGMETWVDQDRDTLVQTLKALLSTLALFEEPGFVIKMMVPSQLEEELLSANSTIRRRWDIYKLAWSKQQLTQIVESRIRAMLGNDLYRIKNLFSVESLIPWLELCGGTSPRGWLELVHPLVDYQQSKKDVSPLSNEEFWEIRSKHPPKLRFDVDTDRVFIGYGEITSLQPLAKKLLRYIYTQKNRTCLREELYYKAHQGLDAIPQSTKDDNWVGRKQWEKSIDTALYRIRQVIEPNPKAPIYLISDTGKSTVHLQNVW